MAPLDPHGHRGMVWGVEVGVMHPRNRYARRRERDVDWSDEEAKRVSVDPIFGLENSFKVYYGQQGALTDPAFMATKRQEEADLRQRVAADPASRGRGVLVVMGDLVHDAARARTAAANR